MDAPDDYLLMSGIQHFAFCRRQWALIHLEQQWAENLRTTKGQLDQLRGLEGEAAQRYFDRFHALILQQKEDFAFTSRSRRPPRDNVNALLSFAYSLLANDCAVALEGVGLDPYVGFLHAWQLKKREVITHPFLKEKLSWGLVPYVQALLLARTLRGDLDVYPPFFWK